jgi:Lecithin retinol acyltransferase
VDKDLFKEFRTDLKEIIGGLNPALGDALEIADRISKTVNNAVESWSNNIFEVTLTPIRDIVAGDHLMVRYPFYNHHGLYLGNREVVHFAEGHIHITSLDKFIENWDMVVVNSPQTYPTDIVIMRAICRVGEGNYHLIFNNCEHFVNWCRSGGKWSEMI